MSSPITENGGNPGCLRDRLRARAPLVGTFVKTDSHQTIEVLSLSGLDFGVIDAEHAPFDRTALDRMMAAAVGCSFPALVRVPSHDPSFINSCLDMGASGLLVPHVRSAADALAIADAARYRRGKRGFSPSGRAGAYGTADFAQYRAQADARSGIWCQIEDAEAMDVLDEIAAIDDVDCLFIGPADLSLSLGASSPADPRVVAAIKEIAAAGQRHNRAVGLFIRGTDQIPAMLDIGITAFVCGSDQGFLLGQAKKVAAETREMEKSE